MSDGPADSQARIHIDGAAAGPAVKFHDVPRYFMVVGTIGFGGPIAAVGCMQRDLVEVREWMEQVLPKPFIPAP